MLFRLPVMKQQTPFAATHSRSEAVYDFKLTLKSGLLLRPNQPSLRLGWRLCRLNSVASTSCSWDWQLGRCVSYIRHPNIPLETVILNTHFKVPLLTPNESKIFQEKVAIATRSTKFKSQPLKSWYCSIYYTEKQINMLFCTRCLIYYYEKCIGKNTNDEGD